jgi:hypothetical protein
LQLVGDEVARRDFEEVCNSLDEFHRWVLGTTLVVLDELVRDPHLLSELQLRQPALFAKAGKSLPKQGRRSFGAANHDDVTVGRRSGFVFRVDGHP